MQQLQASERKLTHYVHGCITQRRIQLEYVTRRLQYQPTLLTQHMQTLDRYTQQLQHIFTQRFQQLQQRFVLSAQQLSSLNPLQTLSRGFAIATQHQRVLKDTHQLDRRSPIHIQLSKGSFTCQVTHVSEPTPLQSHVCHDMEM